MSVSKDTRTTLATCFQRGALSHAAEAYLNCAREEVSRGHPFPVELVIHGVVGRLESMENYVPKDIANQAKEVRKQIVGVVKLAQKGGAKKGFSKNGVLKAIDAAQESLSKLDYKLQDKCQTFW